MFLLVICTFTVTQVLSVLWSRKEELKAPSIVILVDSPLVGRIVGNSVFWSMVFDNPYRANEEGYDAMHTELVVE